MLRKLIRFGLAGAVSVGIGTAAPMVRAGNPVTGAADKAAEQAEGGSAEEKDKGAGEATPEDAKKTGSGDAARQGTDTTKDDAKKAGDKANNGLYDPTVRPVE